MTTKEMSSTLGECYKMAVRAKVDEAYAARVADDLDAMRVLAKAILKTSRDLLGGADTERATLRFGVFLDEAPDVEVFVDASLDPDGVVRFVEVDTSAGD